MKLLVVKSALVIIAISALYAISGSKAQADDWGCKVVLCLSNPGGPTQYGECVPPIHKLWRELARGHAFPTCSGANFHASRPHYQPYYCDAGFTLRSGYGPEGSEESCISDEPEPVSNEFCSSSDGIESAALSAHWVRASGRLQCESYVERRPNVRNQPYFVDITVKGVGTQRVWF